MQSNVSIETNDKDIVVKYGLMNLRDQREAAVGSVKYVLSDISDIKKNYFCLGFHLWEFQNMKYYEDFGYATMAAFCEANFDMDKSAVSRCINVFLHVCQRQSGSLLGIPTMFMQEKYQDYSYSQLCEMVSMPESLEKFVKPDMTVAEIRKIKKDIPLSAAVIKRVLDYIMGSETYSRKSCMKKLEQLGSHHSGHFGDGIEYQFKPGKVQIAGSNDYYSFVKILDKYATRYSFSPDAPDREEKVATSQQTDVNRFDPDDLIRLKGAALTARLRKAEEDDTIHVTLCRPDGSLVSLMLTCDILFMDNNHLILREVSADDCSDNDKCWKVKI